MQLTLEHLSFYLNQCENKRLSWHTLKAYRIDLKQFYSFRLIVKVNSTLKNKVEFSLTNFLVICY